MRGHPPIPGAVHGARPRPKLLVSVRSAVEALVALESGAALIDVKEPANGPLGRANDWVIAEVVAAVDGRCPVSAALGELLDDSNDRIPPRVSFVKWGLAGFGRNRRWQGLLDARPRNATEVVAVAYADYECARAPAIEDVLAYAARRPGSVLLVDTCCKTAARPAARAPTLLDWMRVSQVVDLCRRCRDAGVRIALAGSLGLAEIRALALAYPDWFAVRGAACEGGRDGVVSAAKVRELTRILQLPAESP